MGLPASGGVDIIRLETCTSTQDEAKARAREGAPDGTVVIAKAMTGGRGTRGRDWHAPPGGLYLSVVLRGIDDPHLLTLALGNAVADVLEVAGAQPRLKWVNDVLVDGRKIAGVLAEGEAVGDRIDFIVAGIGVNTNGSSADWPVRAVTLEDVLGAPSCMEDLEGFLLESVAAWVQHVRDGDEARILDAWRERDACAGATVGFDPESGEAPTMHAAAHGIDDEGRILLEVDGRVQAFGAGRVFPP